MFGHRYRAWRFLHPAAGVPEQLATRYGGILFSSTAGIEMVEEDAAVGQAVYLLLATSPGERVMRPLYGCDLRHLVFSPNDETTAGLAIHYVRQALQRGEPRVEIVRIDAGRNLVTPERMDREVGRSAPEDDSGAMLDIFLEYRVRSTQRVERLIFSVDLAGEKS